MISQICLRDFLQSFLHSLVEYSEPGIHSTPKFKAFKNAVPIVLVFKHKEHWLSDNGSQVFWERTFDLEERWDGCFRRGAFENGEYFLPDLCFSCFVVHLL
jgi:hypothetical protein